MVDWSELVKRAETVRMEIYRRVVASEDKCATMDETQILLNMNAALLCALYSLAEKRGVLLNG